MYATLLFFLTPAARRWLLALLGLLLSGRAAQAQIVDDSTKVLYGPKTTRVIYERELRRDSVGGTLIDTTLTHFPQERFWTYDTTFQQNLGQLGTASRPLLYQPNLALGTRLGRNVFDINTRDASLVPYYDSRSPYSFFRLVQSSSGEQVFELSYTRSLKKNFSIGADYERIASNQILASPGDQWLVEHNNFTLFTRFQTEDGRYHLLANYSASRQRTREQGGIWPTAAEDSLIAGNRAKGGGIGNILFKYGDERVYLTAARNIDDRDQVRLMQTYRLAQRGFTAYHILDVRRQFNGYTDDALQRDANDSLVFYPRNPKSPAQRGVFRNATATNDRATYRQVENTLGLLGRTDRVEYNVYGRLRNASLRLQSTPAPLAVVAPATTPVLRSGTGLTLPTVFSGQYADVFLGGTAAFNYRTIYAIEVAGEYKLFNEYFLRGTIRTGPLSAELLTSSYSPTLTQQKFVGNHYQWPDSSRTNTNLTDGPKFNNTKATQLTVRFRQRLPLLTGHFIEASAAVVNLASLVYYDPNGQPAQLSNEQKQLLIFFARHRFQAGKFHFDNQATYTRGAGPNNPGLRIPTLVTESRAYYQTRVFGKALFGQLGAEFYYQSSFKGYGYSPSTQQFYVQDNFTLPAYGIANVFVAADIKAASIFLKGAYINQGLTPESDGYFTTPYFSGYPRRFQLGVRWRFFN